MQFMILDEDGDIVCWLDSTKDEQIVKNGYTLMTGEKLTITEIDGTIKPIIKVGLK